LNKIKAVIFDLDGTIGNTLPLCIKAFRHCLEPLIGRSVSDAEIIATFGPSEEGTIMALAPEHYDNALADYLQHYEAFHNMCPSPFEGIEAILKTLKENSIRIAMVTGKGMHSTAISLKQFGLEQYFELIETGMPAGPRKSEGIQVVLDCFVGVSKREIIYVGDAPSDIIASRKAGVAIVAAAWAETAEPEKLKELKPDEIFYTIRDFSTWLNKRI
jgi:phosphoglycolate phosphatase-like HAD superfamily hydrolase